MSFFDEMKESLVSAGKDVSQKAKEVSGVARLKLDVKSKEDYCLLYTSDAADEL